MRVSLLTTPTATSTGETPPAPTPPAAPPAPPTSDELHATFTDIAAKLTASDATITAMVADRSPVGTGWGPHLSALAGALQAARDALLVARPEVAPDLGARLGAGVIKLAEASGSMASMARQRLTLADGWSSYLDSALADATAAAELLKPVEPPKDDPPATDPPATDPPAGDQPAPASDAVDEASRQLRADVASGLVTVVDPAKYATVIDSRLGAAQLVPAGALDG